MFGNLLRYLYIKYLFILAFIFIFILGFNNDILSSKNFILLNLILLVHFFVFIDYLKNEQHNNQFPTLLVISGYIFFSYTLSFYLKKGDFFYNNFTPEILNKSLLILIIASCASYLGYFMSRKLFSPRIKEIFYFDKIDNNKKSILFFSFILLIVIIFILKTGKLYYFTFISQLKEPVIFFTLGLNFLMILKKDMNLIFLYTLFLISLSLIFLLEIISGVLILIFSILFFLCVIQLIMTKRLSILLCSIFVITVFFAVPIKDKIRSLQDASITERLTITNQVIIDKAQQKNSESQQKNSLSSLTTRLFHPMESLNIVSKLTPSEVSFYEGSSYKYIYGHFIPRIFWKAKPVEDWGNFWGRRYDVLNVTDFTTSWNFPIISEFYANFGMPGVTFGMFLVGFFAKFLSLKFQGKKCSDIEFLVSSTILFNFFFLENNIGQLIGRTYNQIIFFHILFLLYFLIFKYFTRIYKNIF